MLASPGHVPLQRANGVIRESVDARLLADPDGDHFPELAVGRLMGLTASDVSALVVRSLFRRELTPPNKAVIAWPKERYYNRIEAEHIDSVFSGLGFDVVRRYEAGAFQTSDLDASFSLTASSPTSR